jgi:hypothetical protein
MGSFIVCGGKVVMSKPPSKTKTRPGLGFDGAHRDTLPAIGGSAEIKRVRNSFRQEEPPDPTPTPSGKRTTIRREEPDDDEVANGAEAASEKPQPVAAKAPQAASPPASGGARRPNSASPKETPRSFKPEQATGLRPKATPRPPVTVDEVGARAVRLAGSGRRDDVPKVLASRSVIAQAPIDARAAFVLSLVDGRNSVDSLVDMAGMPAEDVKAILARLARLGLIAQG